MATLTWRDHAARREVECPWPVPGDPVLSPDPMVHQTPLGRCALFTETFSDDSVVIALLFPGGHRLMRISPETDWAMEEHWEGAIPEQIAADVEDAWHTTVDLFAARNKDLRASRSTRQGASDNRG